MGGGDDDTDEEYEDYIIEDEEFEDVIMKDEEMENGERENGEEYTEENLEVIENMKGGEAEIIDNIQNLDLLFFWISIFLKIWLYQILILLFLKK